MPRKGHIRKRSVSADAVFGMPTLTKFVNCVMYCGKKSTAERIVYGALELTAKRLKTQPDEVFRKAMDNVKPVVEVKPRRVGGATYQVPVEVGPERAEALAIRWIIQYARAKKGMPMIERLARESVAPGDPGNPGLIPRIAMQIRKTARNVPYCITGFL